MNKKQTQHIRGALNNTLDMLKGIVRRGEKLPDGDSLFERFSQMVPFPIQKDTPSQFHYNRRKRYFEALFCFNGEQVYLWLEHEDRHYRGNPYIQFYGGYEFINLFDPEEYYYSRIISHIKKITKLNMNLPDIDDFWDDL